MKTNVVYLNKDFNINPQKQIVYCRLVYGISLEKLPNIRLLEHLDDFVNYLKDLTNPYTGIASYIKEDNMIVFETSGVSYCSPKDNFDIELGKKVSLTRAQENAFKESNEFYTDLQTIIKDNFIDPITVLQNGTYNSSKKCKSHVYELTNYVPIVYPSKKDKKKNK